LLDASLQVPSKIMTNEMTMPLPTDRVLYDPGTLLLSRASFHLFQQICLVCQERLRAYLLISGARGLPASSGLLLSSPRRNKGVMNSGLLACVVQHRLEHCQSPCIDAVEMAIRQQMHGYHPF